MKKTLSKNVNSIKINKHVILVTKNANICHYEVFYVLALYKFGKDADLKSQLLSVHLG